MSVDFKTMVHVWTDDATHAGNIELMNKESHGIDGYGFTAESKVPLSAAELRAIADKLDELNGVKHD